MQVVGIPIADEYSEYLHSIASQLRKAGVRVTVDDSDDRMQKKIRNHTKDRVPFMMIAGEEDRSNNAVSFRFRDGSQENGIPVEKAIERILAAIANKEQV
jgi:threonyl-tRNA synthetase